MIWDIDPVLLSLGPIQIYYYGVFFAFSLFLAYTVARSMCKKLNLSLEKADLLTIYLVIGLVIGARLGHIVFYELDLYLRHPELILQVWRGGLASHGAAIGLFISYALFLWKNKDVKPFDYADVVGVIIAFPMIFIRVGNFFNSELVGRATDLPWAVTFARVDDIARHPTQLYEVSMGLVFLAIMYPLWLKKYKTAKPGFFLGSGMALYFTFRFLVEFTKDLAIHENLLGLTTGQFLSIPFILFGLWLIRNSK